VDDFYRQKNQSIHVRLSGAEERVLAHISSVQQGAIVKSANNGRIKIHHELNAFHMLS